MWQCQSLSFSRQDESHCRRHAAGAAYIEEKHGAVAGMLARAILRSGKASTGLEPREERTCVAATEKQVAGALEQFAVPEDCEMPEDLNEALE